MSKTVGRSTILSWGPNWEWVGLWTMVEGCQIGGQKTGKV